MANINLIIVDDHPLIRTGIRLFLNTITDINLVAEFESGHKAIEYLVKNDVDIALVDLQMPKMDGIEVVSKIKEMDLSTKVILFTHLEDKEKIKEAMESGASGYLVKDAPTEELINAVRIISLGGTYLGSSATKAILAKEIKEDQFEELTQREDEVLDLIAKGYTNRQIANELIVSETTVKTHVSNILQKLRVESRTQAALIALRKDKPNE